MVFSVYVSIMSLVAVCIERWVRRSTQNMHVYMHVYLQRNADVIGTTSLNSVAHTLRTVSDDACMCYVYVYNT